MTISRSSYWRAVEEVKKVDAAISILSKTENIGAKEVILELQQRCEKQREIVRACEEQIKKFDKSIVNTVCARFYEINRLLKLNAKKIETMQRSYEVRVHQAVAKYVPLESYQTLIKPPNQQDRDAVAEERKGLEKEKKILQEFIESEPLVDLKILKDTELNYLVSEVAA